jgi:putative SOS response-associated peptidase YedK
MCGRYAIFAPQAVVIEAFSLRDGVAFEPRYNAAPLQTLPVIVKDKLGMARWGLLPPWLTQDQPLTAAKMMNARSETIAEKPAFREAWERGRRCLIPVNGFYEWVTDEASRQRQPFFIYNPTSPIMGLAGLWTKTDDLVTFTILTKDATGSVSDLHHREPIIILPDQAKAWFAQDVAGAAQMMAQSNSFGLAYQPVSKDVGTVVNDAPYLIEKLT